MGATTFSFAAQNQKDCCCGCDYFIDSFDRTSENIHEDEVNFVESPTRWKFTDDDWIVGVSTGRLLCQVDDSPIYWYDDPGSPEALTALHDVTLYEASDYFTMIVKSLEIKISFPAANKLKLEIGSDSWEFENSGSYTFPRNGTIGYKLYDKSEFDAREAVDPSSVCYLIGDDVIEIYGTLAAQVAASTCTQVIGTLPDPLDKYGFKAAAGVTLQSITVQRSKPTCVSLSPQCRTSCAPNPIPTSITTTIGGLKQAIKRCVNLEAANDCFDYWDDACDACVGACYTAEFDCELGCPPVSDPGHGPCIDACLAALPVCIANCEADPNPCYKIQNYCVTCWGPNAEPRKSGQCDLINGTYVLTRETDLTAFAPNPGFPIDGWKIGGQPLKTTAALGRCDCAYLLIVPAPSDHVLSFYDNDDCATRVVLSDWLTENGYDSTAYLVFRLLYVIDSWDCSTGVVRWRYSWYTHPLGSDSPAVFSPTQAGSLLGTTEFCEGGSTRTFFSGGGPGARSASVVVWGRKVSNGRYYTLSLGVTGQAFQCFNAHPPTGYLGPCTDLFGPFYDAPDDPQFGDTLATVTATS